MIISEPMGYMLFNERMLETYLHAKKWLKPEGKSPSRNDCVYPTALLSLLSSLPSSSSIHLSLPPPLSLSLPLTPQVRCIQHREYCTWPHSVTRHCSWSRWARLTSGIYVRTSSALFPVNVNSCLPVFLSLFVAKTLSWETQTMSYAISPNYCVTKTFGTSATIVVGSASERSTLSYTDVSPSLPSPYAGSRAHSTV